MPQHFKIFQVSWSHSSDSSESKSIWFVAWLTCKSLASHLPILPSSILSRRRGWRRAWRRSCGRWSWWSWWSRLFDGRRRRHVRRRHRGRAHLTNQSSRAHEGIHHPQRLQATAFTHGYQMTHDTRAQECQNMSEWQIWIYLDVFGCILQVEDSLQWMLQSLHRIWMTSFLDS